jgi:hypothetical protein
MGSPASGLVPRESVAASDAFSFPLVDEFPQAAGPRRAASDTSEDMAIVHPGDGKDRMLKADRGDATSVPRVTLLTRRRIVANALRGRRVTVCQSPRLDAHLDVVVGAAGLPAPGTSFNSRTSDASRD